MRNVLLALAALFICLHAESQSRYFKIRKEDGNRTLKVRLYADIEVMRKEKTSDSTYKEYYTDGLIKEISRDTLYIKTRYTHTRNFIDKNTFRGEHASYSWCDEKMSRIAYNDIDYLYYWNSSRQALNRTAATFMAFSIIAGTIVAPLVSYNFTNKSFNTDRYTGWVLASAVGLGVSIPLTILTGSKEVRLADGLEKFGRKRWEILRKY